jgi:hypothetical protein
MITNRPSSVETAIELDNLDIPNTTSLLKETEPEAASDGNLTFIYMVMNICSSVGIGIYRVYF